MYVAKVAVWGFSPYAYLCRLLAYRSWPRDSMPGLGPLLSEDEIILEGKYLKVEEQEKEKEDKERDNKSWQYQAKSYGGMASI